MAQSIEIGTSKAEKKPITLSPKDRSTHTHIIGASGSGKSKLMERMIRRDISSGHGLCLIDPHGTLYDKIVEWCALEGMDKRRRIHLFEPTREDWTFGFNPLQFDVEHRHEIDYCVDAVMKVFAQVWGGENTQKTPLLKRCLKLTLFTLVANGATLLEARNLTSAEDHTGIKEYLSGQLEDSIYRQEWRDMAAASKRRFNELFSSTNNRLFDFLSAEIIKHIVGQQQQVLDFSTIMEKGDVLLVDLSSRGRRFSRDHARIIGSLIVNDVLLKARKRAESSAPFYLYIDECYRYLNEDIEDILFETRKFGLHLTLAHQDLSQLGAPDDSIRGAVMGGAQTKVVFHIGRMKDAEIFANEIFAGEIDYEEPKRRFASFQTVGYVPDWLKSFSENRSSTDSWGETDSESKTTDADGEVIREGSGSAEQIGGAVQRGVQFGMRETLRPIIEKIYQQGYTLNEQIHKLAAYLKQQETRNAILKTPTDESQRFVVASVPDYLGGNRIEEKVTQFKQQAFKQSPFVSSTKTTRSEIKQRWIRLRKEAREWSPHREEPENW